MDKTNTIRISELDVFRGFMSLQVALYHYTNHYDAIYDHPEGFTLFFPINNTGNRLFVLLSGFVTLMILEKCKTTKEFWIARAIRLFPCYWLGIFLTASTVALFSLPGRETELWETVVNLTMLQRFVMVKDVDGVYWALAAVLVFYFCLTCIFKLNKLDKVGYFCLFWIAITIVLSTTTVPYNNIWHKLFLVEYSNLFIAGIAFYKLKFNKGRDERFLHLLIAAALGTRWFTAETKEIMVDGCFLVLFYLLIYDKLSFLNNKVFQFIGMVSYPMYLIHQNIGFVIIRNLYALGIENQIIIVLTPLLICLCLSTLIFFYFDKPVTKYLQRLFVSPKGNVATEPITLTSK